MTTTLVLGGARSGKSAHAEQLAARSGHHVVYIATAQAGDTEMEERIAHHRRARPAQWHTVEEPLLLAETIAQHSSPSTLVLVDCVTLWLSNLMFCGQREHPATGIIELPALFGTQRAALLDVMSQASGDVVLVANEVGMGITPMGAVSRCFVDEAGRLNQALASVCHQVHLVAAGLALPMKGPAC